MGHLLALMTLGRPRAQLPCFAFAEPIHSPFTELLTMAPHAGVIIAASILVAASIAAYENPQVRDWFEKSSQKVALAFRSLGDDIHSRQGSRRRARQDSSMREDVDEKAEERRRQARQEIMEKGRALQEKRKKRPSNGSERSPSFDSIVDDEGRLRTETESNPWAASSGVDKGTTEGLRSRTEHPHLHESVDAQMLLRHLNTNGTPTPAVPAIEPWESQYEQEMRNAWNIELPVISAELATSHASESPIDLTPTTEDFPDPDYSIPSLADAQPLSRTEYFSVANSQTSHTLSREGGGVELNLPLTPLEPRPYISEDNDSAVLPARGSVAGSTAHIGHSDAEISDDDMTDEEFGDGIRTPGSAWTDVASSVSGED